MRDLKFLYKMEISHRAFVVYAYLADRADEKGELHSTEHMMN